MAGIARRLCTVRVDPEGLSGFVASRLVPIDKNPGVRPIGIGEVPRRIIAKSILKVVENDVQQAVGPLQACAGHEAGCEAAIHAMKEIMSSDETQAVLLLDASSAFNTINRQAALHNIGVICPSTSTVLNNTYQTPVRLLVTGGGEIESSEGIIQGDPLAMAIYALAITPLIHKLRSEEPTVKQVWFPDDSSGGGKIVALRRWWQCLQSFGPLMGYFPNTSKTHLVVKRQFQEEAITAFEGTGIKVKIKGHEMLGSAIGSR